MNEFNVLLAAATNGTPSGSLFDALFARYIAPQESWRELESPLPITILSAGEDLINYRIYGNTESGESVGERTENLFDYSAKDTSKGYADGRFLNTNGLVSYNKDYYITEYIRISSETTYRIKNILISGAACAVCFYDENKDFLSGLVEYYNSTFFTPATSAYLRLTIQKSLSNGMLTEGSTAPTSYIPFGYKLPMVVTNGTTTTTTPIYIGSDPLAEDEYVDFGKQKIYRMEGGTLTPTDPPVPIPALPTIEGETIIDYNPSTTPAVEPEKMYIKYKPQ